MLKNAVTKTHQIMFKGMGGVKGFLNNVKEMHFSCRMAFLSWKLFILFPEREYEYMITG